MESVCLSLLQCMGRHPSPPSIWTPVVGGQWILLQHTAKPASNCMQEVKFSLFMQQLVFCNQSYNPEYSHRLVTGSDNGEIKMWNFNNGHCLIELDKGTKQPTVDFMIKCDLQITLMK